LPPTSGRPTVSLDWEATGSACAAFVNIYQLSGDAQYKAAAKQIADNFIAWNDSPGGQSQRHHPLHGLGSVREGGRVRMSRCVGILCRRPVGYVRRCALPPEIQRDRSEPHRHHLFCSCEEGHRRLALLRSHVRRRECASSGERWTVCSVGHESRQLLAVAVGI
jgi:hypothetical protein